MTITDEELDDFLAHHGVRGMKWGQRKAARSQNRALNKASRAADRQKNDKEIEKARQHFSSGKAKANYKKAKEQYKKDKMEIGSREARKIFNKTKDKNLQMYTKSQEAKSGKETALVLLAAAGAVTLGALSSHR